MVMRPAVEKRTCRLKHTFKVDSFNFEISSSFFGKNDKTYMFEYLLVFTIIGSATRTSLDGIEWSPSFF